MPVDEPLSFYLDAKGHTTARSLAYATERYGRNAFALPRPSFGVLLKEHALAPFFVFQILCVILWSFDDYWCAARCIVATQRSS